jgi:hypothetical protein
MVDVVQTAKADVTKAVTADVAAVKTEVTTVTAKVKAWVAAHVPHAVAAVTGFAVSHFGVISYLVKKFV